MSQASLSLYVCYASTLGLHLSLLKAFESVVARLFLVFQLWRRSEYPPEFILAHPRRAGFVCCIYI